MFTLHRFASGAIELGFDGQHRAVEALTPAERRAAMRLQESVHLANAWLRVLAANPRYRPATVYEYAKVLRLTLDWLAAEPVNLVSRERIPRTLPTLRTSDLQSLFAWLDLPVTCVQERAFVLRRGELPAGYRTVLLSAAPRPARRGD